MKNIAKKSLCLILGVILCSGVAWGMENPWRRKTFRFADFLVGTVSDLDYLEELFRNYEEDLYKGKISDYKVEHWAFVLLSASFCLDSGSADLIARYESTNKSISGRGSGFFRSMMSLDTDGKIGDLCAELKFFANVKSLLKGNKPYVDLLEKYISSKRSCRSIYSKFLEKKGVIFYCPGDVKKLIYYKDRGEVSEFPEIYKCLLFSGMIINPVREYGCLMTAFNEYKEMEKKFSEDETASIELAKAIHFLRGIVLALEKYFTIERIVKKQLRRSERLKDLEERFNCGCSEYGPRYLTF